MKTLSTYRTRPGSLWDFMSEFERAFDTARSDRSEIPLFSPAVDVEESDNHYLISVDLPGVKEEDIKVDVHLGQLSISGKRHSRSRTERNGGQFFERSFGEFRRSFTLPNEVDQDKVQARFENGVLEIFIPKAEKAQAKSIKVETGKGGLFSRLLGEDKAKSSDAEH